MPANKRNRSSNAFKRAFWGYKTGEVDSFIDELLKENANLEQAINRSQELLNDYRQKEESINSALIKAEKTALETNSQAVLEAERLISDAGKEAAKIVNSARENARKLAAETEALKLNIQKAGRVSLEKFLHLSRYHFERLESEFSRETKADFLGVQKELASLHQVKPCDTLRAADTPGLGRKSRERGENRIIISESTADNILLGRKIRKDILDEAGNIIYPRETIVTPEVISSLITKGFYGELIESLDLH